MRENRIAVTVVMDTVAVLFAFAACSCGASKAESGTQLQESLSENLTGKDKAFDEASDKAKETATIQDEPVPEHFSPEDIKPLDIKELEVSEAIVIDDTDEDLLALTDGSEIDYEILSKDSKLPSFYTSDQVDNKDYITPVRNQGYTALCWNYAALGAVESDLLMHHDDLPVRTLNLSEKHGAYYNMHRAYGSSDGGIDSDYREFEFSGDDGYLSKYDTSYLSVGGVTDYCVSLLTSWKGPVVDKDNDSIHVIKGQNEMYTQNADKPSAPFSNAFCHVQSVLEVPATEKNRDIIKRLIMEHGSVTASICADDEYWTGKKVALYDYKKYGNGNFADHEILIVGWNDDYPAKNFITKPGSDGAFICKNSWGENYGASGYFYLSYEDSILCNNNIAAYDCAMPGDNNWYDRNYQYGSYLTHIKDPIIDQNNVVYMYDKNNASYGIWFSPKEDEKLSAIGYFSMNTLSDDKVSIYALPDSGESEKDEYFDLRNQNNVLITMDCKSITGGYHTFPLKESIKIKKDKKYFISITPADEQYLVYEKAMDYTTDAHKDEWQNNIGAVHTHYEASGHSYMQDSTGELMLRQDDKDFFIKVYTNKTEESDPEKE